MSVSAFDTSFPGSPVHAGALTGMPAAALRVEVLADPLAIRPIWKRLAEAGHSTPYQGYSWIESYFRHVDARDSGEAAFVVLTDPAGEPLLLLPLSVRQMGPVRVARFIGGKHSNFNMPVLSPAGLRISAEDLEKALVEAGRLAGFDLFALMSQPTDWEGVANPMILLGGRQAASSGYKMALAADGEALLHERLSKDTRRKMRQKEAKLAAIAPVTYRRAATREQALAVLDAFFTMKASRFEAQGIDDPFACPDVRAFLRECATKTIETGHPTLELHALMLGDRPVAIYGGVADARRFSGVITAFDPDPEIGRSSPGDILLCALIKDCCQRGLATFDLGAGDSAYKTRYCDQQEILMDTLVPVTVRGKIAATAFSLALGGKHWLKHSPQGQRLLAFVRSKKARA